jgi:hypothetical protein
VSPSTGRTVQACTGKTVQLGGGPVPTPRFSNTAPLIYPPYREGRETWRTKETYTTTGTTDTRGESDHARRQVTRRRSWGGRRGRVHGVVRATLEVLHHDASSQQERRQGAWSREGDVSRAAE